MRIQKKFIILFCVFSTMMLVSCKKVVNDTKNESNTSDGIEDSWKESVARLEKQNNDVWVYNPYEYELELFSVKDNKLEEIGEGDNSLEYCFNLTADYPYVSIGDTDEMSFCVYEMNQNKLENRVCIDDGYIVPFATNDNDFLFLMSKIEGEKSEKSIVRIEKDHIVEELNLGDYAVERGILIDQNLYYSVYKKDSDTYDVYQYNMESKEKPVLVKKDIEKGELYQLDQKVLFCDKDKIYNDNYKITYKGVFVKIIDRLKILVQWDTNDEAGMVLRFKDITTGKELKSVEGGINYQIQGNTIRVYTYQGIVSFDI